MPASELEGRVALVTGCAKADGLGSAIARALAEVGARVLLTDVSESGVRNDVDADGPGDGGLVARVEEIRARSGDAAWTTGDVSSEQDCAAMVAAATDRWGRLDIVVSNAAAPHGAERAPTSDVSLEAWQRQLEVNLTGGFLMSRAGIPWLKRGDSGRIVFTSSIAAVRGVARRAAYAASKAGLLGLVRSLAVEVGPERITVNAICPGLILTSRVHSSAVREAGSDQLDAELERRARAIPLGRLGRPDDVADVVRFLVGDGARYLTGQTFMVDGGLSIRMAAM